MDVCSRDAYHYCQFYKNVCLRWLDTHTNTEKSKIVSYIYTSNATMDCKEACPR
jgi:hypothetical protein